MNREVSRLVFCVIVVVVFLFACGFIWGETITGNDINVDTTGAYYSVSQGVVQSSTQGFYDIDH